MRPRSPNRITEFQRPSERRHTRDAANIQHDLFKAQGVRVGLKNISRPDEEEEEDEGNDNDDDGDPENDDGYSE